jgi:hypothetical protein
VSGGSRNAVKSCIAITTILLQKLWVVVESVSGTQQLYRRDSLLHSNLNLSV